MPATIAAVLVTYNRQRLLAECLDALLGQTRPLDRIILVDNASTDGTAEWLQAQGYTCHPRIDYLRLPENRGGAGGFHAGVQQGFNYGYDWLWLMDDDARPEPDALEKLLACQPQPQHLYGSTATVSDDPQRRLCWPANLLKDGRIVRHNAAFQPELLEDCQETDCLPFLGLLIHRQLIARIGYPNAELYLTGDDIDYCERAKHHGARIFLAKHSLILHPLPSFRTLSVPGKDFWCLSMPAWKRYYFVRNRLLIARRHYGWRLWTQTLPGLLIRLVDSLRHDPDRWQQWSAYLHGIHDGFRNRSGKRWPPP